MIFGTSKIIRGVIPYFTLMTLMRMRSLTTKTMLQCDFKDAGEYPEGITLQTQKFSRQRHGISIYPSSFYNQLSTDLLHIIREKMTITSLSVGGSLFSIDSGIMKMLIVPVDYENGKE